MTQFAERRKYQRCESTICKAMMSTDRKRWNDIELCDVSAGGLRFSSSYAYEVDTPMYFNLYVYNMLSEFNMKLEGHVVRKECNRASQNYAVKFDNVDKYVRVQLDELIKSKVSLINHNLPAHEDGTYAFMFIPHLRRVKLRRYR